MTKAPLEYKYPMVPHPASDYRNKKCRCPECKAANVKMTKRGRERRHQQMISGKVSPTHGKESTYFNYMCRCLLCTKEHTKRQRKRDQRREG